MKRSLINPGAALLLFAFTFAATVAHAANYQVGGCLQGPKNFPTIQTAVNVVPPGSTIFICPGWYAGQVTISQPLTLRGVAFNNQDRPVIALTDQNGNGGYSTNANSLLGEQFVNVVLVQNVSPPGDVNILNVTVDGSFGDFIGCGQGVGGNGSTVNLAGIFYDSGTSGQIQATTVRNIKNPPGCGYGIWIQNGNSLGESVKVNNVTVHDFDNGGISAFSNQNPPTLDMAIFNNSVQTGAGVRGIAAFGVTASISNNVVTGGIEGIHDSEYFPQTPGVTVSNNSVANASTGVFIREGSTAKSNRIADTQTAFDLFGGSASYPGAHLLANTIKNTGIAIDYNCSPNVSLKSNTINDAQFAFHNVPSNLTINNAVNPLYNVDTINSGGCP